ncbi:MAG: phage virion morphogenesis protein [Rhizobiales bacterium]|nr:phage virion morphogenesis protein [Hyphomicrobiales bacterium]
MTGARIVLDGGTAATEALLRTAAQAENTRGLWDNIGASLAESTRMRFERGERPDGGVWPQSIRARLENGKTLIDSARLMQSITWQADDRGVEVGTNVLYAAAHQLGATIRPVSKQALRFRIGDHWITAKEVTIPARPFLGVDHDDEAEIEALTGEWLLGPQGANDVN